MPDSTLLIGVGQHHRGDDEAGLLIARAVDAENLAGVEVAQHTGDGTGLMDLWEGRGRVVVVDAASSGAAPGTIHRFDVRETTLPTRFFRYSTHAFALAEAVETARRLGTLPESLSIVAIEGTAFAQGAAMTAAVRTAVAAVVIELCRDLSALPPAK